jgi:hypothetical protein
MQRPAPACIHSATNCYKTPRFVTDQPTQISYTALTAINMLPLKNAQLEDKTGFFMNSGLCPGNTGRHLE